MQTQFQQECIPVGCVPPACARISQHALVPGGVYLPRGDIPAQGVFLARGVHLPGGCTCLGVYLPGGVPVWGGVSALGVPAQGDVPAWGCTCQGSTCLGGICPGPPRPREQNDRQVQKYYLPQPLFAGGTKSKQYFITNTLHCFPDCNDFTSLS